MNRTRGVLPTLILFGICALGGRGYHIWHQSSLNAALWDAANADDRAQARTLLLHGAQVNSRGGIGETPLMRASLNGDTDLMSDLLSRGADVNLRGANYDGWTALQFACWGRKLPAMALLIQHGADVNAGDRGGFTPLHIAANNGYSDVVRALLTEGADPAIRATNNGTTALQGALAAHHQEVARILERVAPGA